MICVLVGRYFIKQVNNESWRQWNPIETFFWLLPHSGHCVTISALPPPPHFSCQEGQQKPGRVGGRHGLGKKSPDWLLYTLADKGPCQQRQIEKPVSFTTNRYLFFNLEKPSLLQIRKKHFLSHGTFSGFLTRWKKFLSSGFPCVVEGGWYQHNGVALCYTVLHFVTLRRRRRMP